MNRILFAAALLVAAARTGTAAADPGSTDETACTGPIDEKAVVRCALAASPEVRAAQAELEAANGRRRTAGIVLPSNPTIGGTLARRQTPGPDSVSAPNWNVTLSQELEIAGQRGTRIESAEADVSARARRLDVAEREVAAGALAAFYEAQTARESLRFADELTAGATALVAYAEERAKEQLIAGVEADVARAEAARIGLVRFEAERRLAEARATLAVLLDVDPGALALPASLADPAIAGPGDPAQLEDQALRLRGEVTAAEMERRVLEARLSLLRRARVPNPTLSAFVAREEIDDRVVGIGLSIPIPLPEPVGRTRSGDIAEAVAQVRAAEASAELVRRRVRLEVARALAALKARQAAAAQIPPDLVTRAHADLASLREAVKSRQLALREGLLWQRSLIDLLQADIDARLARALAWVELRRVAALPLVSAGGGGR